MNRFKFLFEKHKEIIVYFIVGFLTTVVNWISYAICVEIYNMSIASSNFIAWALAVAFAYITNKICVFKSRNWEMKFIAKEILLFVGARLSTGILETIAVPFFVWLGLSHTILGIDGMFSKIIVSIAILIFNYIFSKLIIFRKKI